ncbi:DUF3152 domain-containing protein [Streptomyces alboniger]|uniref:DUF3152 domain-containing protein n=1 Tax=Streptomyces alboniger TaxID=132473 RepID=A0A5J6HSX1_STRAD|nr:DUF3152 domain-containing protein [Streptomyces alboniger]QEV20087.1 DUF3152 domain-containing protein [Streptomyces alboniger]
MGRHSRRGPAGTPADKAETTASAGTTGTTGNAGATETTGTAARASGSGGPAAQGGGPLPGQVPGPGTGRRRRGPADEGTPAHGTPAHGTPQSTPSHGVPGVRGGHPEQREPGGGWGDVSDAGSGPHPGAGHGIPGPRQDRSAPRQDYVEAFTDGGGDPYASVTDWNGVPEPGPGPDVEGGGGKRGGRARLLTGIAAAAVITVLGVVVASQVTGGADDSDDRPQAAPGGGARDTDDPASRSDERPPPPGGPAIKPDAAPVTYGQKMGEKYPLDAKLKASGDFEAMPGFDKAPGKGQVFRYRVDVEKGLGLDGPLFAQAVQKTLNDKRSWAHAGARAFERISSGKPDFVITLASPGTTAAWCAKSGLDTTQDNVSCDSAATDRVMINAYRWAQGAKTYGDAIHPYRQMLINHEVGHRLGFNHTDCTKDGDLAPVMQQQTKFLEHDGIKCKANPWAFPKD